MAVTKLSPAAQLIKMCREMGAGTMRTVYYDDDDEPVGMVVTVADDPERVRAVLTFLDVLEGEEDADAANPTGLDGDPAAGQPT